MRRCLDDFSEADVAGLRSSFVDQTQKTKFVREIIGSVLFAQLCFDESAREYHNFKGNNIAQHEIEELTNLLQFDAWDTEGLPKILWIKDLTHLREVAIKRLAGIGPERCFTFLQKLAFAGCKRRYDDPIQKVMRKLPKDMHSVCKRGIKELVGANTVDRLAHIALILSRAVSEHSFIGDRLLASPDTEIYFDKNEDNQMLIETYINQVFEYGRCTEDMRQIEAVWTKMSPEEANNLIEVLDRSVAFKEAVWNVIRRKRTNLFLTEHPRLVPLFQPIHETERRVRRWGLELRPGKELEL